MSDSILAKAGTVVRGHEFHRTACVPSAGIRETNGGAGAAWRWSGADGGDRVEGFVQQNVHASYLHLHWAGVPGAAVGVVTAARAAAVRTSTRTSAIGARA